MDNYNSHSEKYEWNEPNVTYMDELHPLVVAEKAQAIAVSAVALGLAKVLVATMLTSMSAHAKYSQKDIMRDRTIRRALDV